MEKEINDIMASYQNVSDIDDPRMVLNDIFWLFSHIRKTDDELAALRVELDALEKELKEKTTEARHFFDENKRLIKENEKLKGDCDIQVDAIRGLKKRIERLETVLDENERLEAEVELITNSRDTEANFVVHLRKYIDEIDDENVRLRKALEKVSCYEKVRKTTNPFTPDGVETMNKMWEDAMIHVKAALKEEKNDNLRIESMSRPKKML